MNGFTFPEEFLWGASTSAFQVEGGAAEGGKGPATTDRGPGRPGISDNRVASDFYHHWREDIELMAELGIDVYRMGFSWSRIMPDATGEPNPEGLAFYDAVIDRLLEKDIEPLVTLYHFECPQVLVDAFGGWKSRRMIDAYLRYAEVCFRHFKGRVKRWVTVNEQLIATAAPDNTGDDERDPRRRQKNTYQMSYHVALAEHRAIALLRSIDPDASIGPVCAMQVVYPRSSSSGDILAAMNAEEMLQNYLLDLSVRGTVSPYVSFYLKREGFAPAVEPGDAEVLASSRPDFLGVNYYFSSCARERVEPIRFDRFPPWSGGDFELCDNPCASSTEWMANGIDPLGLRIGMRRLYDRYQLPMIVTENGMALSEELSSDGKVDDPYRIDYLAQHIAEVGELVREGYPVLGYCVWSLMDLCSSHQGFAKRYGLVFVDRTDTDVKECRRVRKSSFFWYQQVIENRGLPDRS
ncbi:glycoside hydrolase family 1 protein [Collinsella sp. An2]|uniref:glycoside hydrolase family 1 protein n=1 Tax=Collinsella sp. An2 TaxID=1965585 RepID=UPI000B36D000|nr:glycoside hydrolase family 1 protein [Collinsella sp. An2]OUP09725.1 6-phospho-beta-glucosidase [Collinsella sp. An2]